MSSLDLPPKPDAQTGDPRPPDAPLLESAGPSTSEQDSETGSPPDPPPGRGPTLEWFRESSASSIKSTVGAVVVVAILLTLAQGFSVGWMQYWWAWLALVGFGAVGYFGARRSAVAAGADWLKHKKSWVDTYELTTVKISSAPARLNLELEDSQQRRVFVPCLTLERNRKLWNLVYNGILHSAHARHVKMNNAARSQLDLPQRSR